ncbi:MAG: hypothetical protein IT430_17040 [Phycisphaerales bacterium]|nr:hypothetical protein [Phycisphaerales bacterium]
MRTGICLALAAAAMAGAANRASAQDPVLSIEGVCPGEVSVSWEGAMSSKSAALVFSHETGAYRISIGAICGGTTLGLGVDGLRLLRRFNTGPEGAGAMHGTANPYSCGGYLQIVVVSMPPCETSNVVQIP